MIVDKLAHTYTHTFHILVKLLFGIFVINYFRSAAADELQGETSDPEIKDINHNSQMPLAQSRSSNTERGNELCSERLDFLKIVVVCGSQGTEVSDFEDTLFNTPELQEINEDNAKVEMCKGH